MLATAHYRHGHHYIGHIAPECHCPAGELATDKHFSQSTDKLAVNLILQKDIQTGLLQEDSAEGLTRAPEALKQ